MGEIMLQAATLADALTRVRSTDELDNFARSLWSDHGKGAIGDDLAQELSQIIEQRREALKCRATACKSRNVRRGLERRTDARATGKRTVRRNHERKRTMARAGLIPGQLVQDFTEGETAALSAIGCAGVVSDWPIAKIAAIAGVSVSTVRNALRKAARLGILVVTERRMRFARSLTNVVRIVSKVWTTWLSRRGGYKSVKPKDNKSLEKGSPTPFVPTELNRLHLPPAAHALDNPRVPQRRVVR